MRTHLRNNKSKLNDQFDSIRLMTFKLVKSSTLGSSNDESFLMGIFVCNDPIDR